MTTITEPAPAPAQDLPPLRTTGIRSRLKGFGRPPRIMGLDVARGVALLGMVIAHVGEMPDVVWSEPETWGGLVHGRSSILFALLAGISIALVTGRSKGLAPEDVTTARLRLVGRGIAIFALGLVLELLSTPVAVILTFYGILFVGAIPFLRWSARRLLIVAAIVAVAGPVLLALIRALTANSSGPGLDLVLSGSYPLTVWVTMLLAGMGLGRWGLESARAAATILVAGVLLAGVGYGAAAALAPEEDIYDDGSSYEEDYVDSGQYGVPGASVDTDGLLCDVYEDDWVNCYPADDVAGASMPSSSGMSSSLVSSGSWTDGDEEYSYGDMLRDAEIPETLRVAAISDYPHSGGVAEIIGSGGFAMAMVGLCLLLARPLRWALIPIAALGSMPLTIYSGHLVVIMIAMGGPTGGYGSSMLSWVWFSVGLIAFATVWALLFGRGPLERLVGRAANAAARVR